MRICVINITLSRNKDESFDSPRPSFTMSEKKILHRLDILRELK